MNGFQFGYSCNACGDGCHVVTESRGTRWRNAVIVECDSCRAQWMINVTVTLVRVTHPPKHRTEGCGTITGYRRHYKEGSKPCDACKEANRVGKRVSRAAATIGLPDMADNYVTCPECGGDGNSSLHPDWYHRCPTCGGKGWVEDDD